MTGDQTKGSKQRRKRPYLVPLMPLARAHESRPELLQVPLLCYRKVRRTPVMIEEK